MLRISFSEVFEAFNSLMTKPSPGSISKRFDLNTKASDPRLSCYGRRELDLLDFLGNWSKKWNEFFPSVILHGSLALGDFTNYSDVDVALVVKDEVFCEKKLFEACGEAIRHCARQVLEYDPLQHHGFHVIPEVMLSCFPAAYLPVSILLDARILGRDKPTQIDICQVYESSEAFAGLENVIRGLLNSTRPPTRVYAAKLFLSSFMLLPALALQAEGRETTKRTSFEEFASRFSFREWEPMAWATHIRAIWPCFELTPVERMALETFNPWLVSRVLLMRRPLPEFLAKEWTPERHVSLLAFAKLVKRTVSGNSEFTK